MALFSSGSKKKSSPASGSRRSPNSRNEGTLKKLKVALSEVDKLEGKIAKIDNDLKAEPKEKFTRGRRELLAANRLNWKGQLDEALVNVDAIMASIEDSNQRNLNIAKSKHGKTSK